MDRFVRGFVFVLGAVAAVLALVNTVLLLGVLAGRTDWAWLALTVAATLWCLGLAWAVDWAAR
jgi:hypothetical protein